jgi:predicted AAA+ superfamily ATPase
MVEQIIQVVDSVWTPYFFRTSDGIEIDLLLSKGKDLVPIEVKAKLSINKHDIAALEEVLTLLKQPKGFLVNLSDDIYPISDRVTCIGVKKWIGNSCAPFWNPI